MREQYLYVHVSEKDESVKSNFKMYNLRDRYIDVWMGDQMNTALRRRPMFDAIVTDRKLQMRIL
jgi:tRNA G10  N-methylase Trm11